MGIVRLVVIVFPPRNKGQINLTYAYWVQMINNTLLIEEDG